MPVTDLASTLVSAPGAAQATYDYADIPVQSFSPPAEIEEEVKRIRTPPIVVEEPRVATEQLPTKTAMPVQINGQQEREEEKAQTIDEAVKKFDDVVSGAASNLHEESPAPSILHVNVETANNPDADYHAVENSQTGPLENPMPVELEQPAASSEKPPSEESTTKAAETNVLPEVVESLQLIPVKDAEVDDGTGEMEDMDVGSRPPGDNVKIDSSPSLAKKEEDTHSNVGPPKEATIADPEPPSDIIPETVTPATSTPAGSNRSTPVSKSQKKKNKKKKKAQASATATAPREESEANGNDEGLEDIDLN